jgi:hypothetical protein
MSKYTVMVDDNFHYMDQDERWELGTFATLDAALAACRKLVDEWLAENHKAGMTAAELCQLYMMFGEDPFIVGGTEEGAPIFSAWNYAQERCALLCAES